MADRGQELGVLEAAEIVRAAGHEVCAQAQQVRHDGAQARRIHAGLALEHVELREVPLELLLHVGAYVAARGDGQDVEQAAHGGAAAPLALHFVVVQRLVIEKIEAQEGAHALIERLLEYQRCGFRHRLWLLLGLFCHRAILRERGAFRKPICPVARVFVVHEVLSDCARAAFEYCRWSVSTCVRSAATSSLFSITSSATARRCSRVTCAASMRCACSRVLPSRACSRASWMAGSQSTTSTRSKRAVPAVSTSSGIATMTYGPVVDSQRCSVSWRMAGWVSCSSHCRSAGLANTRSRRRARSRLPSGCSTSRPKCSATCASKGDPRATTSRARTSVSTMEAPSAANRLATVLLPQAMPPVRPTRYWRATGSLRSQREQAEVTGDDEVAGDQRDPAGDGEKRSEGDLGVPALALPHHDHDADDGAHAGGEHDDGQQHLPAHPGAERGEQLEVAVTHAFLAGDQLERPVHTPQAEITGHGADDAVARPDGRCAVSPGRVPQAHDQTQPQQRVGE